MVVKWFHMLGQNRRAATRVDKCRWNMDVVGTQVVHQLNGRGGLLQSGWVVSLPRQRVRWVAKSNVEWGPGSM